MSYDPMKMLREFHETYGATINDRPTVDVPNDSLALRLECIREEFEELVQAVTGNPDI